jgi:hypothetical protein
MGTLAWNISSVAMTNHNADIEEAGDILRHWVSVTVAAAVLAGFAYGIGGHGFNDEGTPSPYITEQEAIQIARNRDASGTWRAYFVRNADVTVDGKQEERPIWVLHSTPLGQPTNRKLYVDATTGAPLQETFFNIVRPQSDASMHPALQVGLR